MVVEEIERTDAAEDASVAPDPREEKRRRQREYQRTYYERNKEHLLEMKRANRKRRAEGGPEKQEQEMAIPTTQTEVEDSAARQEARRAYKREWWREHHPPKGDGNGKGKKGKQARAGTLVKCDNEGRTDPKQHLIYDPNRLEWIPDRTPALPPALPPAPVAVAPVELPPAPAPVLPPANGHHEPTIPTEIVINGDPRYPQVVYREIDQGVFLVTVKLPESLPEGFTWDKVNMSEPWRWAGDRPYYLCDRRELPMYCANALESILRSIVGSDRPSEGA